ncbi:hypothetical protein [Psychromonas sp. 14N.309.X.WAT.B.A12]|uniref:hypothetical protein n=1 Tax=unclassified Psychromonas TaxID=2614957 RepID=UPI0025B033DD|nr:hypothetical protein [Psychromonas sp. 14N.309.X.WAT.B.A12]MDN2664934.1 hypothetical protein [Psychromonas sp. 14N.309.X.WAT.B.A12]
MRVKLIKDFLLYIEDCHKALAELYQRLSLEANDEKVKLLLEYMRNKEQLSYCHLHQYVQQAPLSLLNAWLEDIFDQSFPQRCKELKFQPELALEDVVTLAIQLDIQLIEAMQVATINSSTSEAEIALEGLTSKEEEMLYQVVMASHEFEYL